MEGRRGLGEIGFPDGVRGGPPDEVCGVVGFSNQYLPHCAGVVGADGLEHGVGEAEGVGGEVVGGEDREVVVVDLDDEGVVESLDGFAGGVDLLVGLLVLGAVHDRVVPGVGGEVEAAEVVPGGELLEHC